MKKKLQYSVILLLLAGIFAFAGCSSPLEDALAPQAEGSTGLVKILVNGESGARTLAPTTLGNATYVVFYRPDTGGDDETPYQNEDKVEGLDVPLAAGNWDLKVVASVGTAAIAEGTGTVTVVEKKTSTLSITLEPNAKGDSGTFHYDLDYSGISTVTKAWMTLAPYTDSDNSATSGVASVTDTIHIALEDENLGDGNHDGLVNGNITLPAGIYTLDVRLTVEKANGGGYTLDDHTNGPTGTTTVDNKNVDIHKTEIVYIYSGQTTSMDKAKYTFRDADLTKLYFEGRLTIEQSNAIQKYNLSKIEVYQVTGGQSKLVNIYTENDAATAVPQLTPANTANVKPVGNTITTNNRQWDWNLFIPAYELGKNITTTSQSLRFVFEFSSATTGSTDKLYSWRTVTQPDDMHGKWTVTVQETIRQVTYVINEAAITTTTGTGSNSLGTIAVNSQGYRSNATTGYGEEYDLPVNRDVIVGQSIWATVTQANTRTPFHSVETNNQYDMPRLRKVTNTNITSFTYQVPSVVPNTDALTGVPTTGNGYRVQANFIAAGAKLPLGRYYDYSSGSYQKDYGYVVSLTPTASFPDGTYLLVRGADEGSYVLLTNARNLASNAPYTYYNYDSTNSPFYSGWQLPTIYELGQMQSALLARSDKAGFNTGTAPVYSSYYWSRTAALNRTPIAGTNPVQYTYDAVVLYKVFASTTAIVPTLPVDTNGSGYYNTGLGYMNLDGSYVANNNTVYGWTETTNRVRIVQSVNYDYYDLSSTNTNP